MAQRAERTKAAWRIWTARLLPWVLTAVVVAYILTEYSLAKIRAQIVQGDPWAIVGPAVVSTIAMLLLVAVWDTVVLQGFLGGPRYRDVVRGKAAASVLLTLGYGFGHGGYSVWIARMTGSSVARTVGVSLYITSSDLCALSIVATLAAFASDVDVPRALQIIPPCIAGGLLVCVMTGPYKLFGALPVVFRPWTDMSRRRQLGNIAGRMFNITFGIAVAWVGMVLFGMPLPIDAVYTYLPLVIFVGALPVNVAGFGPVQGAWLVFFGDYAPGAQIIAFQFLWHAAVGLGWLIRGLPFLKRVVAEVAEGNRMTRLEGAEPAETVT